MIQYIRQLVVKTGDSISFRLMVNYGLLAFFSILVLVAFIYLQVIGTLHSQAAHQASASLHRLVGEFENKGRNGLIRAINTTLSDPIDGSQELYLLLDEKGLKLAGNLDNRPKLTESNRTEVAILRDGYATTGRILEYKLNDGGALLAGIDLDSINMTIRLVGQACLMTLFIAFLLVVVGAYMFRRELDFRVGSIRKTAVNISEGHLSSRIPLSETKDEFYYLNEEINSMLDKIESLMTGVRHVSNTIAHNLRTPLTRILNRLRSIPHTHYNEMELRDAIRHTIKEIEELDILFNKLLHISEIQAGIQRRTFRSCDLNQIAENVVDLYEVFAEEENRILKFESQGKAIIRGDADLLANMLAQLIENAIKYAHSEITVRINTSGQQARLSVSDDGPGIPASELPNIGQHFYQLNPEKSGFGLGLTSVRAIVAQHEGSLEFNNNAPGLIVSITLPMANDTEET